MKTLRNLIRLDAVLLAFFGLTTTTYTYTETLNVPGVWHRFEQEQAPLVFLGTTVTVLAIVLFLVSDFALIGHRRKLGTLLALGNLVIAVVIVAAQPSGWVRFMGWIPAIVLLIMAIALAWASRRPLKPNDAAADFAALQIPDDIRQALLRQIGEAAAQEERNRLARDLHDSIKQQLFTINVSTAAAQELWERDPEKARGALADVRRSAQEAMVEMQALLHQLRPQALTSTGLVEAIREQCEALGYRTGAKVTLELGDPIPDDRVPPGAQEMLFRIVQEALSNVARHARARNVRVWLGLEKDSATLRVQDDGQGFDSGAEMSGMGLRNLRERTESLQGALEIASAPGAGTTVTVSIPVMPPLPSPDIPAVAIAIHRAAMQLIASVYLAWVYSWSASPKEPYEAVAIALILLGYAAWNWRSEGQAALFKRAALENVSRLRHALNRNRAFYLFLATCWSGYTWSLAPVGWNTGRIAWGAAAFLCAVLTGLDLIRYHRQSRLRSAWPKWTWTWPRNFRDSMTTIGALLLALVVGRRVVIELEPRRLLWTFLIGIMLVYLLMRQSRVEGLER
jgi:signal transduction histidine kinase